MLALAIIYSVSLIVLSILVWKAPEGFEKPGVGFVFGADPEETGPIAFCGPSTTAFDDQFLPEPDDDLARESADALTSEPSILNLHEQLNSAGRR